MFHRIVYIILLVSLSFSVDLVKESYNFEYNDNHFTSNNLGTNPNTKDSPTNVFAVMNSNSIFLFF